MAKNIQSLQFLRNGTVFQTKAAAITGLEGQLASENTMDGNIVLARYNDSNNAVKSLAGIIFKDGSKNSVTIIDTEDVDKRIQELYAMIGTGVTTADTVTKQLASLSGSNEDTSATTSVEGAKKYADALIEALDAESVSGASKVVIDVTQTDGAITATAANLTGVKLDGYAEGSDAKIAATDTLGEALGKLQGQINAMDLSEVGGSDGDVITSVSEADGKVSASKSSLTDVKLAGYTLSTATTGSIAATDTLEQALNKIENAIADTTVSSEDGSINIETSGETTDLSVNIDGKTIVQNADKTLKADLTVTQLTSTELESLGTNVKEAYKLVYATDEGRAAIGDIVKIYKDSSLSRVYIGHIDDEINSATGAQTVTGTGDTALCFVYHLEDGTYSLAPVNVQDFLEESEFADGLVVANHVVKVSADSASESVVTSYDASGDSATTASVLSVSATGVKVSNIQTAIDAKVASEISLLDASVTGGTTAGTATADHVQVVVDEADGKLTAVTVTETNIADADDLAAATITAVTANGVAGAITTGAAGTSIATTIKGDDIEVADSYTSPLANGVSADSTIDAAFLSVENNIKALDDDKLENVVVNGNTGTVTGNVATVVVGGDDIKLDNYAKASSATPITSGDSVNEAIGKLEKGLEGALSGGITGMTVNSKALAISNNVASQTVSGKQSAATATNNEAIVVETDNTGNLTLGIAVLDAGLY